MWWSDGNGSQQQGSLCLWPLSHHLRLWGKVKTQRHMSSKMCLSLINPCLSELEVFVSELNAFNPDTSVVAIDRAFCHTCLLFFLSLYFITYWLTSWVLQVHKSPSFKRLLCVQTKSTGKDWYLNHRNKELHLSSFSFICKSEASKDSVIMMKLT